MKVLSIYRLSDIALILAMWMMHHLTHQNISFTQLTEAKTMAVELQHGDMALFIAVVIVLAAVAKSAQLPFTSWFHEPWKAQRLQALFFTVLYQFILVFFCYYEHTLSGRIVLGKSGYHHYWRIDRGHRNFHCPGTANR